MFGNDCQPIASRQWMGASRIALRRAAPQTCRLRTNLDRRLMNEIDRSNKPAQQIGSCAKKY